MLEVEAKLKLRDRAGLERRLRELGASPGPAQRQEDTFFRHPQRDLAALDAALRLRRVGARLELTYKGPKQGGPTKARVEQTVGLATDPTALLASLGFTPAATLSKTRVPYHLGVVEVALDVVDGVGEFVEVEATGSDREAATSLVEDALRRLGLHAEDREQRSYLELALMAKRP
ncbi:MAG: class IV adenylate cyclase [Candidatus Thermoplasmatota archaeon]